VEREEEKECEGFIEERERVEREGGGREGEDGERKQE
jgi:hypothetical protein